MSGWTNRCGFMGPALALLLATTLGGCVIQPVESEEELLAVEQSEIEAADEAQSDLIPVPGEDVAQQGTLGTDPNPNPWKDLITPPTILPDPNPNPREPGTNRKKH